MFVLPLYIFLLIYFVFIAIIAVFYLVFIYHLIGTGSLTIKSVVIALIILFLLGAIVFITFQLLSGVDWRMPLIEFNLG